MRLCAHFPHLMSSLGDVHMMFLTVYDFHDNRRRKCRPFYVSVLNYI